MVDSRIDVRHDGKWIMEVCVDRESIHFIVLAAQFKRNKQTFFQQDVAWPYSECNSGCLEWAFWRTLPWIASPDIWLWMILATICSQPNPRHYFLWWFWKTTWTESTPTQWKNKFHLLSSETLHTLSKHSSCQFSVSTAMVLHDADSHSAYVFHWQFNLPCLLC